MTPPEHINDDENGLTYRMVRQSQLSDGLAFLLILPFPIIAWFLRDVGPGPFRILLPSVLVLFSFFLLAFLSYEVYNRYHVFSSNRPLTITKDSISFHQIYRRGILERTYSWQPIKLRVSQIDTIVLVGIREKTCNPNEPLKVVPFARMEFLMKYQKLVAFELGLYQVVPDLRTIVRFFNGLNIPVILFDFTEYNYFMEKFKYGLAG